ncbi:MAG TPA: hypothetical protein VFV58_13385 [Blastocatellia bacterium]|jgi:hypothetical protein|nr:hypothetical protein [Blastocatellia bacterium]
MRDIIIDAIVLAGISSLFIAAGLRLLLAKRPFIVDNRWWGTLSIAPLMLSCIKILILWPEYLWQSQLWAFFASVAIGGMAILLGLILWAPGGGIVIGATWTTLRDALRQAFSRLGVSYEESAKAFRLPALNNELFAQAHFIDEMFYLRFKRFRGLRAMRLLARQLAPEVKEFFRTAPVRINKRVGYALVAIGVAFLLFDSLVTYEQLS